MAAIPFLLLGKSLDGQEYVLVHHAPSRNMPVAVSIGEIDRIKREAFEPRCRELIVASLDAFSGRSKTQPSAFDRLSDKTEKAFYRANRFISATLREAAVELAPFHVKDGDLIGCEPHLRLQVNRDEPNEAFIRVIETAFARC